jgi:ubiquitin conjugation factor E4 B
MQQVDPLKCASSGMFVNLSAVMLRLCEPFLDNMEAKKDKIDVNYLFCNNRIDFKWVFRIVLLKCLMCNSEYNHVLNYFTNWYIAFDYRDLTAINASSEEVSSWIESINNEHAQNNASGEARFVESQEATSSGKNSASSQLRCSKKNFSFVCECFFMTSRVLNLGLMKAISDFKHISQVWRYLSLFHIGFFILFTYVFFLILL